MNRFAILITAIAGLAIAPQGMAQSSKSSAPAFEAASLKPGGNGFIPFVSGRMKGGPGSDDPDRITYTQISLPLLVTTAWDVEEYQLAGPAWFTNAGTDEIFTILATMPPNATKAQLHPMLRNLLMERFRMKVHRETRNLPGYELVVVPGGSKLRATTQDPNAPQVSPLSEIGADGFMKLPPVGRSGMASMSKDGTRFKCQDYTLAEFIEPTLRGYLKMTAGASVGPITDKTGLTGRYDFQIEFDGRGGAAPVVGPNVAPPVDRGGDAVADPGGGLPNLFTALEKQLGLKLVKIKSVPVEMLVIDQGDKVPTPN